MAWKAEMGLTKEQYKSLCWESRLLLKYWMEWRPSLHREAVKDGDLYELVRSMGERMQEQMTDLIVGPSRLTEQEAREIVWEDEYKSAEM